MNSVTSDKKQLHYPSVYNHSLSHGSSKLTKEGKE